jgi:hypothetical protein
MYPLLHFTIFAANSSPSQNKNTEDLVAHALGLLPSFVGIQAKACASKQLLFVRHVPKLRTSAKRACWISNTACQHKCETRRWLCRMRLLQATSTESIMLKIWRARCVRIQDLYSDHNCSASTVGWESVWTGLRTRRISWQGNAEATGSVRPILQA